MIGTPFTPTPIKTADYCTQNGDTWTVKSDYKTKYNIKYCCTYTNCINDGDRWAGAMVKCNDSGGHIATLEDLATIAAYLYDAPENAIGNDQYDASLNTTKLGTTFAGLGSSWELWSANEFKGTFGAFSRRFYSSYTETTNYTSPRYHSYMAICVK